jgi:hypothetical protein
MSKSATRKGKTCHQRKMEARKYFLEDIKKSVIREVWRT